MKVNSGLRVIHEQAWERFGRIADEVCGLLTPEIRERKWFYTERLKGLESFALKLENGRVDDPTTLEDFFACTIVVHRMDQIAVAEQIVLGHFELKERRPTEVEKTHKRPSDFPFDDLRLYVTYRSGPSGRNADLDGTVFEVQIKTVLQYAWGLAVHDLIYKTDTVSWPKERIAFQVRAMLEHAEVAIAEAQNLSASPAVAMQDEVTEKIVSVIAVAEAFWSPESLPDDRKRMAESFLGLLKAVDMSIDRLGAVLEAERVRLGMIPLDLDPYGFMVQALANSDQVNLERKLKRSGVKIVVHDGMDIPDWMRQAHHRIINIDAIAFPR